MSDEQPKTPKAAKHPKSAKRKKPATRAAPEKPETPETPAPATGGELVRQPHGGALKRGGTNRGGGRPRSQVRADMLKGLDDTRHVLLRIALSTAENTRDADRIRAIEVMGRLALDASVRIDDVRECLREQARVFYKRFEQDTADELLIEIRPIWLAL